MRIPCRRKTITYFLISLCVVVILINFVGLQNAHNGQQEAPGEKNLLPVEPKRSRLSFEERFAKYENDQAMRGLNSTPGVIESDKNGRVIRPVLMPRVLFPFPMEKPSMKNPSVGIPDLTNSLPLDTVAEFANFTNNEETRRNLVVNLNSTDPASIWNGCSMSMDQTRLECRDRIPEQMAYIPKSYQRYLEKSRLNSGISRQLVNDDNRQTNASNLLIPPPSSSNAVLSKSMEVPPPSSTVIPQSTFVDYPVFPPHLLKTIFVPAGLDEGTPLGTKKFAVEKCPVAACNLTIDRRHAVSAHLRLLQLSDSYMEENPEPWALKPPNQIWVVWLLESPANSADFINYKNLINWTATYRSDSQIVTPYARFVPYSQDGPANAVHKKLKHAKTTSGYNYAAGKTKMAAWFVSNCDAQNKRWEYVQELKKYIPVDIFGACGEHSCGRESQDTCNKMLSKDYKFYMSFENSNCDYYITEKFFEVGLGNNIVPVAMGGRKADYLQAAPPHSFIHVEDFSSAKHLAAFLVELNNTDSLYNEYFRWKGTGQFINTKFWCRLCAMLHDDEKPKIWYSDFNAWWRHPAACRSDRWEAT